MKYMTAKRYEKICKACEDWAKANNKSYACNLIIDDTNSKILDVVSHIGEKNNIDTSFDNVRGKRVVVQRTLDCGTYRFSHSYYAAVVTSKIVRETPKMYISASGERIYKYEILMVIR